MQFEWIQKLGWLLWGVLCLVWEVAAGILGIPLHSPTHKVLSKRCNSARTYQEWFDVASQLDELEEFGVWRLEEESRYFNFGGLARQIRLLMDVKKKGDSSALLSALSTRLHRSVLGILNPQLYTHRTGTKAVIETYNSLLVYFIRSLTHDMTIDKKQKYLMLSEIARVYGRSALVFNGGMIMGSFHAGVAKALWEAGLLPRIIYGERTGAVVAALLCCLKDIGKVFDPNGLDFSAVGSTGENVFGRSWKRFLEEGHLMDMSVLVQFIKDNIGELTFLEAYKLTGRVLNIQYPPESRDTDGRAVRLLNYLTSPNVLVYSAAAASFASIPLIFARYPLLAKDLDGRIIPYDVPVMGESGCRRGGIADGLKQVRELYHVKCFILSECSATRLPFLRLLGRTSLLARVGHAISQEWWRFASFVMSLTPLHRYVSVLFANDVGWGDDVLRIFPASSWSDIATLFSSPTWAQLQECILRGERQVWPRMVYIRQNVAVEMALADVLKELREADPSLDRGNLNPYKW